MPPLTSTPMVLVAIGLLGPAAGWAQVPGGDERRGAPEGREPASVAGTLVVEGTGRPLAGLVVELLVQGVASVSDSAGRYRLAGLRPGWDTLRVRGLDFKSEKVRVRLDPGAAHSLVIEVPYPMATLDELLVTAERSRNTSLAGFERRLRAGSGRILTRQQIEHLNATWTHQLFWRIPGVLVRDREVRLRARGHFTGCRPHLFVNGVRTRVFGVGDFTPGEIAAVEVHRAPFIPGEFHDPFNDCGIIVLWTRALR